MEILRQPTEKRNRTFLTMKGKPVPFTLVSPIDCSRVPAWLEAIVVQYARRFDWGLTYDARGSLKRLWLPEVEHWGCATGAEGVEGFVSLPLDPEGAALSVQQLAKNLNIECAFAPSLHDGHVFVLAPKGSWKVKR